MYVTFSGCCQRPASSSRLPLSPTQQRCPTPPHRPMVSIVTAATPRRAMEEVPSLQRTDTNSTMPAALNPKCTVLSSPGWLHDHAGPSRRTCVTPPATTVTVAPAAEAVRGPQRRTRTVSHGRRANSTPNLDRVVARRRRRWCTTTRRDRGKWGMTGWGKRGCTLRSARVVVGCSGMRRRES